MDWKFILDTCDILPSGAIYFAAKYGYLEIVKSLMGKFTNEVAWIAAANGHIAILELFPDNEDDIMHAAIAHSQIDVVKFMLSKGVKNTWSRVAIKYQEEEIFKILPTDALAIYDALYTESVNIVNFLTSKHNYYDYKFCITCVYKDPAIFKPFAANIDSSDFSSAMFTALRYRKHGIIDLLLDRFDQIEWKDIDYTVNDIAEAASQFDNFKVLKYMIKRGANNFNRCAKSSAKYGLNFKIFKYLIDKGANNFEECSENLYMDGHLNWYILFTLTHHYDWRAINNVFKYTHRTYNNRLIGCNTYPSKLVQNRRSFVYFVSKLLDEKLKLDSNKYPN